MKDILNPDYVTSFVLSVWVNNLVEFNNSNEKYITSKSDTKVYWSLLSFSENQIKACISLFLILLIQ